MPMNLAVSKNKNLFEKLWFKMDEVDKIEFGEVCTSWQVDREQYNHGMVTIGQGKMFHFTPQLDNSTENLPQNRSELQLSSTTSPRITTHAMRVETKTCLRVTG